MRGVDLRRNAPSQEYYNTILTGILETYPELEEKAAREYLDASIGH
jgi:hypothetical protein